MMERSPSASRLTAARRERPIRRWISTVRPDCFPAAASRRTRELVAPGNMPYSAVTQPLPVPFNHGGVRSSRLAVQITLVSPNSISVDPAACLVYCRVILISRSSSTARPLGLIKVSGNFERLRSIQHSATARLHRNNQEKVEEQ